MAKCADKDEATIAIQRPAAAYLRPPRWFPLPELPALSGVQGDETAVRGGVGGGMRKEGGINLY